MDEAVSRVGKEELRLMLRGSCDLETVVPVALASAGTGSTAATSAAARPARAGVPAAVLVGLLGYRDGPRVVLTERTSHLRVHAAQISFPGGRIEEGDEGPAAAALREAFEEVGLPPARVEVLGCLPLHLTVSNYLVHPFVGWVEPPVEFAPHPGEVAHIVEVPLAFVLDSANHRWETLEVDGVVHGFHVLYYDGHRIWGATAGILVSLARLVWSHRSERGAAG